MENLLREVFPNLDFSPNAIKLLRPLYERVVNNDWTEHKIRQVFPGDIAKVLIAGLRNVEKRNYGIEIFILITEMLIGRNQYITGKQILNRIENDEELFKLYKYVLRLDIENYVINRWNYV